MSKEINKDPMPIFKNMELKYGIISMGLEMPSGTVIKAPSLPERYSPREIDKNIIPISVLAICFGANLETSEYTTGPGIFPPSPLKDMLLSNSSPVTYLCLYSKMILTIKAKNKKT